jgi:RNA polymerase sigma factor (TIGR02999 family)
MGEVTVLLDSARQGQTLDMDRLFELLYPELKRIAHARLCWRDDRLLLDTAVLVHETYLRMLGTQQLSAPDRGRFLAYAARVMRSVVVDMVREQQAQRRGGGPQAMLTLNTAAMNQAVQPSPGEDEILAVHAALQALASIDERLVQVVEMRYFVGMDAPAIAQALGVTVRTVDRDWQKARSFLFNQLQAA